MMNDETNTTLTTSADVMLDTAAANAAAALEIDAALNTPIDDPAETPVGHITHVDPTATPTQDLSFLDGITDPVERRKAYRQSIIDAQEARRS